MDMTGKVVLVTGGGSGIGRLACQLMSRRGARVLALDVNEQGLAETAAGDCTACAGGFAAKITSAAGLVA